MNTQDGIARGVVGQGTARVVVVVLTEVAREAARRHDASGAAALAMGRVGAVGLLLATLTKSDERVNVQVLGDGPLRGVTADASANGNVRVFVGTPAVKLFTSDGPRPRLGAAVGTTGVVSVLRDLGLRDTFRGQTPLVDGEIDTDIERYLIDSEQIDSAIGCDVFSDGRGGIRFAAGILVQALPGGLGTEIVASARQRLRAGIVTAAFAAQLAQAPDTTPGTQDVAEATLGEYAVSLVQLTASHSVQFHCPCSRERAAATLGLLGERELLTMIDEDGCGQVTCEFCRQRYDFTEQDLENVRRQVSRTTAPPS